jgi:hypothetical protein
VGERLADHRRPARLPAARRCSRSA